MRNGRRQHSSQKVQGKFITQNQITGQKGINLIERFVLEMGFTWTSTSGANDAGIDGIIEIRDPATGEATNLIVQVQSKATETEFESETATSFVYRVKERDLNYWLQGNAPVLLVVSRPSKGEAYWIPVKEYFKAPERRTSCKVQFDKIRNLFDKNATSAIASQALPTDKGIYLRPPPKEEILTTNLLEVKHFASKLFVGVTHYNTIKEVENIFKELDERPGRLWFVKEKKIFSFHNLTEYPWTKVTDLGAVEEFNTKEWAVAKDTERQNDFVRLLNQALRTFASRKDFAAYTAQKGRNPIFFFRPRVRRNRETDVDELVRREESWKLEKASIRTLVEVYRSSKDQNRILYYRHHAFEGRFRRFENRWFLEISPTYHYTSDGINESKYRAENLAGMKRQEGHQSVANNVQFLAYYLAQHDLINKEYPFLGFGKLLNFQTDFGIPDLDWKNRADPDEIMPEEVLPDPQIELLTE
ncbi:conserved hypothetical protein [Pedosphaera parvula Ellin514]|uniref:DUF4365 domain-containing protein n=2 Tax=Pedosphaera TaxID=1032526 RepID=B9X9W6_PEDPL|nr:conserved hypothetical protein [Pedosphaera parvula Ellin514]